MQEELNAMKIFKSYSDVSKSIEKKDNTFEDQLKKLMDL